MRAGSAYFEDAAGSDAYMGRWGRAAGAAFLAWLEPPAGAKWLEIGCGTGTLTGLVLDTTTPAALVAVDSERALIDHARTQRLAGHPDFLVADARSLPFACDVFDVVVAGLVLNFIPDPLPALAQMRRVARSAATIGAYVWDFAGGRSPGDFLRTALGDMGIAVEALPGAESSRAECLESLFAKCGLPVESRTIDVTVEFSGVDDLCRGLVPCFGPRARIVSSLPASRRAGIRQALVRMATRRADGRLACSARAHAVKAIIPAAEK